MSDYHTVGSPAVEVGVIEIDEILYKNLITTDNFFLQRKRREL